MLHITKGLEPLWDDQLADLRFTDAVLSSNRPEKAGSVFICDAPWEGNGSDFFTILKDGDRYRMYYLGWAVFERCEGFFICYAESSDGINWIKPSLGIYSFHGSTDNNILMGPDYDPPEKAPQSIFVMKDENPACPSDEKYKAVTMNGNFRELRCLVSGDGIRFREHSIISSGYLYDSVNTLWWNAHTGRYYCYFRSGHSKPDKLSREFNESSVRDIMVSESEDMKNWSEPKPLDFMGAEDYPLYTNCVSPYPYDDRYYVGFPTRYVERRGWSDNFDQIGGAEGAKFRRDRIKHCETAESCQRYGTAMTDCVFMSSRDAYRWYRFDEACLSPGPENKYNWNYGDCYPAVGLIETSGRFDGDAPELSLLCEAYHWHDRPVELIRYVWRKDGFASYKAPYKPKTLRTKPFTFDAETLSINFRTSVRGNIYVKLLDELSNPIEGYESGELFGDSTDRALKFERPLSELAGKVVRLDFTMSDAELFALRFS